MVKDHKRLLCKLSASTHLLNVAGIIPYNRHIEIIEKLYVSVFQHCRLWITSAMCIHQEKNLTRLSYMMKA